MRRVTAGRIAVVACFAIAASKIAWGTVTQVDGTIVPVLNAVNDCDGVDNTDDNLQICFNTLEGVAPPNPNAIDAIRDAATVPEVFVPNTAQAVLFRDISEGAGFENSFGYYNVGDDVLTAQGRNANLHPILGCGVPMVAGVGNSTTHSGNPAAYEQNAQAGEMISVDFAVEQAAGRYKGGFIGFYLITPEGNPSSTNCGDFKNDSGGNSLFGHIYYTQKDLNNDGDFVHHLVYRSKLTADRFYFGFEDLFRGGDNDFEDMLIQVTGLTPPCVPQAEVCDGIDNDCDGLVDGNDPDLTGVGAACTCDGVGLACDNGPRFGQCQTGVTVCNGGAIQCHGTGTPSGEICDGVDNNCNNVVDDNPSGTGAACDGADADLCPEGTIVCQNAMLVCNDTTGASVETCNGADDDCDGATDEGNPGGGGQCGSSIGVCTPGTLVCSGGSLMCQGATTGGPEVCNGLDDDCDGVADDSPTDVGQPCGTTAVGECELGETICVGGSLSCAGEVGPTPERCNSLDDDCDTSFDEMPVDAGQPCGSSIGACEPGALACAMGMLQCVGGVGPTAETCNGIDDDCNGSVDEGVPGEGEPCGGGMGPCAGGMTKCISGTMQCVGGTGGGTETCNNIDDDCDGNIDEGPLCNGGICDMGVCAAPCIAGEFPCPAGKTCQDGYCVVDPCYGVSCPPDAMGNAQACSDGQCQPICPTVECPAGYACRGSDGTCVPDTCDYLPKCAMGELCINGTCVADKCIGVTCPAEQFCRDGACVASCDGVQCGLAQVCKDGACVDNGCGRDCGTQVCDAASGQCVDDRCVAVQCPTTQVCDPATGQCVPDPCQGVICPGTQTCKYGQCGTPTRGEHVTTGGGGGCAAGGGEGIGVALAVLALVLRRRRRAQLAVAAAALALAASACDINEYCLQCGLVGGDAGTGDGGDGDGGGGGDAGTQCDPTQIRPETCNGADDDCDLAIDETIDKQNDELNCGGCGIECNKPGAQTVCSNGGCTITGCFPGFVDDNGDTTGPYAASDGCEYPCFSSNGGVEACDDLDNDCDGDTDEGFDKTMDPSNCGMCGRVCEFFAATGHCMASTCMFDPTTDCDPGYVDRNGMQDDGCEYECTPTNGGVEACDLVDNDCDGGVDEDFNLNTDPNNCGSCGFACEFPNATASCMTADCAFDPMTDCDPGFVDADGKQLNGCEYECTPTGAEVCDGADNDCDGVADDNPTDAGGACAATMPPEGACVADGVLTCASGQLVCSGATQPAPETCDNADNDCDGTPDDGVTQSCYTGTPGTDGVGACHGGTSTCSAGMFGACMGEVTPTAEQCNNIDDDCDGTPDDGPGGGPITQSCYGGAPGTAGVGTCQAGTQTCAFGSFGSCAGEVQQSAELCGDGLDTDCDNLGDDGEGCLADEPERRLDVPGGSLGESTQAAQHSYDVVLAHGSGGNVYAAWSQRVGSATEVYFRASADGGLTWGTIINVTSGVTPTAVKPQLAVAAGSPDRIVVAYQTVSSGVRDIRVSTSANGGTSFAAAVGPLDGSGDSFHHAVAVAGTTVVVTWEKLDTSTLIRDVQSRVSTNGGASFGAEFRVNVGSGGTRFAGQPRVGITASGGIIWAWREQRSGSTRDMFAAAVASPTATPTSDIRLDADMTDARDSDLPALAVVGDRAYVVWQDVSTQPGGGADVMFAQSTDSGASWSTERIVDDPSGEVSSSFSPALAVDPRGAGGADDLVTIAWEDRRQGAQIFARTSVTGGATFDAPVRASSEGGSVTSGATSLAAIAAAGGDVLVVAYQHQQTNEPPHVYVASSIDAGATWTLTHTRLDQGTGAALAPAIAGTTVAGGPGAVIAWSDFRNDAINGDVYAAIAH